MAPIKIYDLENSPVLAQIEPNPVELPRAIMHEHRIIGRELAKLLDVSEGLVSDMLNYKKAISKAGAKILPAHFKLQPDTFLRPYELENKQQA